MLPECCAFCGATATRDEAVEADWIPSYWDVQTDVEVYRPVCAACVSRGEVIFNDQMGDYERIPVSAPEIVLACGVPV